ncbi:GGDEF domain [Euzebya pacifica]|uniref:GGDEF domain n=1 Tax=Euzebya pacifica TaxID=1608957 RepID=A0A346Y0G0_9ACTN|nr:GGDEF domain-containing protein [Euzebya pacifica]AXV07957.1 GGDEF domain [Euzebya pacifica]
MTVGTHLLVVLLVLSAGAWSTPLLTPRLPWAVLVAGFAATGAARIRLRLRSASHEFVVDELAIVVGIFTATPLALASAAGFATLGWQLWRRRPLLKASFNVGIAMLEASVAAWVAHGLLAPHTELGPAQWGVSWLAVLLAMSASTLLIRRVIALTADSGDAQEPAPPPVSYVPIWMFSSALVGLVLAGMMLVLEDPRAGVLLAGPVGVVLLAYRAHAAALAERVRLLHESQHDPLTGLANRRGLVQTMANIPPKAPVTLLSIDLDDFKAINDAHGHAVGDEVLRVIGLRLRGVARRHDLVARMGGDEFVVLLSPAPEYTDQVVERVKGVLHEPVHVGELTIPSSASIGVETGPLDGLLDRADRAMYRAKRTRERPLELPAASDGGS